MPALYDIKIYQGQAFKLHLVWKDGAEVPIDVTGYTARMQIRRSVRSSEVLFELSSAAGEGITLGTVNGVIDLRISAEDSSAFTFRSGVYDLELTPPDGEVVRLIQGGVTVSPEVTR